LNPRCVLLSQLVSSIKQRRLVIVCGAGLSLGSPSSVPSVSPQKDPSDAAPQTVVYRSRLVRLSRRPDFRQKCFFVLIIYVGPGKRACCRPLVWQEPTETQYTQLRGCFSTEQNQQNLKTVEMIAGYELWRIGRLPRAPNWKRRTQNLLRRKSALHSVEYVRY
jgi:hypothetical protein